MLVETQLNQEVHFPNLTTTLEIEKFERINNISKYEKIMSWDITKTEYIIRNILLTPI